MLTSKQAAFRSRAWICHACRASSTSSHKQGLQRRVSQKLPYFPTRTRFAPSPTGYLHLGSLRTALYNYLLAKATGGQFLLRLEDTDTKRTIPGAEERLYHDLRWAGLNWDEGPQIGGPYGPYRQSERTSIYQEHAHMLLKTENAYRCFCSPERLKELAKRQNQYDGACRLISDDQSEERAARGEAHVIRLKVPAKLPIFDDIVYGTVGKPKADSAITGQLAYEDLILLKSDGLPTYHLANVVDDKQMRITHVIRAAEWMSSTPKHIQLYKAFGWDPPKFAHVGLLQDSEQQKLSKRDTHAAGLDVRKFQDQGIFPEALLNYATLFGWSHKQPSDVMSLEDLVRNFDFKFTKGDTIVMPEKLKYIQKEHAVKYIKERGPEFDTIVQDIYAVIQEYFQLYPESAITNDTDLKRRIVATLETCGKNYYTPREFHGRYFPLFQKLQPEDYFSSTISKKRTILLEQKDERYVLRCGHRRTEESIQEIVGSQLEFINRRIVELPLQDWNHENLSQAVAAIRKDNEKDDDTSPANPADSKLRRPATALHFIRWVLVAGWSGPSIAESMIILGREITLQRFADIRHVISAGMTQ